MVVVREPNHHGIVPGLKPEHSRIFSSVNEACREAQQYDWSQRRYQYIYQLATAELGTTGALAPVQRTYRQRTTLLSKVQSESNPCLQNLLVAVAVKAEEAIWLAAKQVRPL